MFPRARIRPERRDGFALVLSLVFLGFILLLMVSFVTMVQVETFSARSQLQQERARQTARLGLKVALGDLQKTAGPDRRITAPASLFLDRATSAEPADAWTGVWRSGDIPAHRSTDANPPQPSPLRWLVSGYGERPDDPDPSSPPPEGERLSLGDHEVAVAPGAPGENRPFETRSAPLAAPSVAVASGPSAAGPSEFAFAVVDGGAAAALAPLPGRPGAFFEDRDGRGTLPPLRDPADRLAPALFPFEHEAMPFQGDGGRRALAARLGWGGETALAGAFQAPPLDLAPATANVLANAREGGLQNDLTEVLRGDRAPPEWAAEPMWPVERAIDAPRYEYARTWPLGQGSGAAPLQAGAFNGAAPTRAQRHPMLARVQLFVQATPYDIPPPPADDAQQPPPPPKIRLHLFPAVILWNPYDVPLRSSEYVVEMNFEADIQVTEIWASDPSFTTLRGYPGSRDETPDSDQIHPPNIVPLFAGNSDNAFLEGEPLRFRLDATDFEPGETLVFSPRNYADLELAAIREAEYGDLNELTAEPPFRQFNSFQVDSGIALHPADADWHLLDQHTGHALVYHRWNRRDNGAVTDKAMRARLLAGDGRLLQEVDDLIWVEHHERADDRFSGFWNDNFNPVDAPDPSLVQNLKGHIFFLKPVFAGFAGADESAAFGPRIAPFGDYQPWAARGRRDPATPDEDRNPAWGGVVANQTSSFQLPDIEARGDRLRGYTGAVYRLDHLPPATSPPGNHFFALHQPRAAEDVLSLGALQHLPLTASNLRPGYAAGSPSPAANDLPDLANRAFFDRTFLSGGRRDASEDGAFPFRDPRLQTLPSGEADPAGPADPADPANALRRGALNVNSPYPRAWLGAVASYFERPVEIDRSEVTGGREGASSFAGGGPFFRALRPALGPVDADAANPAAQAEAWRGFRSLGEVELRTLADAIATEVRGRGPFGGLADFANSGALAAAIENAGLNANFPDAAEGAPGFLSQNDLLQAIAPALAARSDTFRIRAAGATRNRATGELESRALGEAVVQRLPEPVDAANGGEAPFGRRFRVVEFRFLAPDTD